MTVLTAADFENLDETKTGLSGSPTQAGEYRDVQYGRDCVELTSIEELCAGLGISSQENWEKAEKLAELLRGTLGYTRPAVDMGYAEDESAMIGISGSL